jgi:hypothetical protein
MLFYYISEDDQPEFCGGAFVPWPSDLGALILDPKRVEGIEVKLNKGKIGDMLVFGVISQRLLNILESCHATGYLAHPIKVEQEGCVLDNYYLLKITGRGGPLDEEKSGVVRLKPGETIYGYKAVYMDESKWDGSDVFAIPELGIATFVVERVGNAIKNANLPNIILKLNTEFRHPDIPAGFRETIRQGLLASLDRTVNCHERNEE